MKPGWTKEQEVCKGCGTECAHARTRVCVYIRVYVWMCVCTHTVHMVGRLTGVEEGRSEKRLREHFQKRGLIYILGCNWFVCVEQKEGGSGGNMTE